eukprot:45883-Eustigmatos_ZCMA.PRE.1
MHVLLRVQVRICPGRAANPTFFNNLWRTAVATDNLVPATGEQSDWPTDAVAGITSGQSQTTSKGDLQGWVHRRSEGVFLRGLACTLILGLACTAATALSTQPAVLAAGAAAGTGVPVTWAIE